MITAAAIHNCKLGHIHVNEAAYTFIQQGQSPSYMHAIENLVSLKLPLPPLLPLFNTTKYFSFSPCSQFSQCQDTRV